MESTERQELIEWILTHKPRGQVFDEKSEREGLQGLSDTSLLELKLVIESHKNP